jgi:hypothetical protein
MAQITRQQIERWLGKRRMAKVSQIWSEGNGIQVVLKAEFLSEKYDTDGIFLSFEDSASFNKDVLMDFFSSIVAA